MKKIYTLVAALLIPLSMYAGGTGVGLLNKTKDSDSMLGNGFFVNLGVGLPSTKLVDGNGDAQSLGIQPTLQIGNQWYFVRNSAENFGFGLNVSWLTIGASAFKVERKTGDDLQGLDIYSSFLRFGPMATYAINEDMAIDGFFDLTPVLHYQQIQDGYYNYSSGETETAYYVLSGLTFTPGVKFRYKKLMVGVEYGFGRINQTLVNSDNQRPDSYETNYKIKSSNLRFLLGLKF